MLKAFSFDEFHAIESVLLQEHKRC